MYSTEQYDKDKMARAKIVSAVVSPKDSREVSAALRGKSVAYGLSLLADVKTKKRPIRFTRFNQESAGHRRGIGPGRYPFKAADVFETLLESVKANAEFKDLDTDLLRIVHIKADIAPQPFRFGRHRGRTGKRAHIEVVVVEDDALKAKAKKQSVSATKQKATSKKATKADVKEAEPKAEKKTDAKADAKPKVESKPEAKSESKSEKTETKAASEKETKSEKKTEAATPQTDAKDESKTEAKADKPEAAKSEKKSEKAEGDQQ